MPFHSFSHSQSLIHSYLVIHSCCIIHSHHSFMPHHSCPNTHSPYHLYMHHSFISYHSLSPSFIHTPSFMYALSFIHIINLPTLFIHTHHSLTSVTDAPSLTHILWLIQPTQAQSRKQVGFFQDPLNRTVDGHESLGKGA